MLRVEIYFYSNKYLLIENVIMVQTINGRLVILYKVDNYKDYTEVKYYSMSDIDYYQVGV